jgi:outer membrane PBP1 activator LpoA protein
MPTPGTYLEKGRIGRWIAAVALAWAAAFSNAQTPPASDTPAPAQPPAVAEVDVALVLPLESPAYARAAEAVRAGFEAAAEATGGGVRTKVFAHGDDGVLAAFDAAQKAGARVIVGPLVRDDLKVLAAMAIELPYTIALNQFDEAAGPPPTLFTFPLSIESDARLIARHLRETPGVPPQAVPNVVVLSTDTPLMRRFASAFTAEWLSVGGSVPGSMHFDPAVDAMTAMRRELVRKPPGAVVLAMDGANVTFAKPYLGSIPSYASALVFERETLGTVRDLDGLIVAEIPWIVTPGAPQFTGLPRRDYASAALTRLYALGLDAFRIAKAFAGGVPEQYSLEGATGQITLEGKQLLREGRLGIFREGRLTPLDASR